MSERKQSDSDDLYTLKSLAKKYNIAEFDSESDSDESNPESSKIIHEVDPSIEIPKNDQESESDSSDSDSDHKQPEDQSEDSESEPESKPETRPSRVRISVKEDQKKQQQKETKSNNTPIDNAKERRRFLGRVNYYVRKGMTKSEAIKYVTERDQQKGAGIVEKPTISERATKVAKVSKKLAKELIDEPKMKSEPKIKKVMKKLVIDTSKEVSVDGPLVKSSEPKTAPMQVKVKPSKYLSPYMKLRLNV